MQQPKKPNEINHLQHDLTTDFGHVTLVDALRGTPKGLNKQLHNTVILEDITMSSQKHNPVAKHLHKFNKPKVHNHGKAKPEPRYERKYTNTKSHWMGLIQENTSD